MRYIGTYITDTNAAERVSRAINSPVTVGDYKTRTAFTGELGSASTFSGLAVTNDQFICCVLLECDPEDLPKQDYVLECRLGTLTVPADGSVACAKVGQSSLQVNRSVLKNFLRTTTETKAVGISVTKHYEVTGLELLGTFWPEEQINALLEVL